MCFKLPKPCGAPGGTQEECMFTEFPELLASIYVTESLGNELLYAEGMREGAVCVVPVPCGSHIPMIFLP